MSNTYRKLDPTKTGKYTNRCRDGQTENLGDLWVKPVTQKNVGSNYYSNDTYGRYRLKILERRQLKIELQRKVNRYEGENVEKV